VAKTSPSRLESFVESAAILAASTESNAVLFMMDHKADWEFFLSKCGSITAIVASFDERVIESAQQFGLATVLLEMREASIYDRLSQAILESVADEFIVSGGSVVAVYSGFDNDAIDSISIFKLGERLGKLTARDLQKLETNVPLDTLKSVVDLAVEIGREGREGKAIGTMFVVGDHRRVMEQSRPAGFDFVKGYTRKERNINDHKTREGLKEIALMDGAFVVSADGTVIASCRLIDTAPVEITMTTGLGARHFSAAAISKNTNAIAVAVSESNGTVRIFQNGEVVLRIEPLRRALKWKGQLSKNATQPTPESD